VDGLPAVVWTVLLAEFLLQLTLCLESIKVVQVPLFKPWISGQVISTKRTPDSISRRARRHCRPYSRLMYSPEAVCPWRVGWFGLACTRSEENVVLVIPIGGPWRFLS
jgi:hypothetical protein